MLRLVSNEHLEKRISLKIEAQKEHEGNAPGTKLMKKIKCRV